MRTSDQPWYDNPLHREATRSLSCDGGKGCAPTIYADPALAAEHLRYLTWLREQRIDYWNMSGAEFEALKTTWRASR